MRKVIRIANIIIVSILLAGLILIPALPKSVYASTTVTIQPSSEDNYLDELNPNTSYSTLTYLSTRTTYAGGSYKRRSVIEFDINWGVDIPVGANISSANLSLYYYSAAGGTSPVGKTITAYRVLRTDWVDSESSWNNYKTGSAWTVQGCGGNGADFTTANSSVATIASYGWMTWDITSQVLTAQSSSINAIVRLSFTTEAIAGDVFTALFYSSDYATDTSLRPKLVITYESTTPAITVVAASSVGTTTARLNSSITDDGGDTCEVRWGYGTTSKAAINFDTYDTVTSWAGSYSTGATPYYDASSLTDNTTYYFRVQVKNSYSTVTSTDELSFTTSSAYPTIVAVAASSVAFTSARLNSSVTYDGGEACQVRFGYDTSSHTSANFTGYANITSWTSAVYTTSSTPYYDATSLNSSTTYYFRIQIKNSSYTMTCVTELSFTTSSGIGDVASFNALPLVEGVVLSWIRGEGATDVRIVRRADTYPLTISDGTIVTDANTGNTYEDTDLDGGVTYFYSIWGHSSANWSSGYLSVAMTTLIAGATATVIPSSIASTELVTPRSGHTVFQNIEPLYSIINDYIDGWGMDLDAGWVNLWLLISMVLALLAYMVSGKIFVGFLLLAVSMMAGSVIGILPIWVIFVIMFMAVGYWVVAKPQQV